MSASLIVSRRRPAVSIMAPVSLLLATASTAHAQWSFDNLSPPASNISTVTAIRGGVPVGYASQHSGAPPVAGDWSRGHRQLVDQPASRRSHYVAVLGLIRDVASGARARRRRVSRQSLVGHRRLLGRPRPQRRDHFPRMGHGRRECSRFGVLRRWYVPRERVDGRRRYMDESPPGRRDHVGRVRWRRRPAGRPG